MAGGRGLKTIWEGLGRSYCPEEGKTWAIAQMIEISSYCGPETKSFSVAVTAASVAGDYLVEPGHEESCSTCSGV